MSVVSLDVKPNESTPSVASIARLLLQAHEQKNYAFSPETGLICAPIGYYRELQNPDVGPDDEEDAPSKMMVFGFEPEHLDLIPHPDIAGRMMLKHPDKVFSLPPRGEPFYDEWMLNAIKSHQQDWLTFVLNFGNLYNYKKSDCDYFANRFISYGIFHDGEYPGIYRVTYRANPFNEHSNFGLHQEHGDMPWGWVTDEGVTIRHNFHTFEEAKKFVHQDFCERYANFLSGVEVQSWEDPEIVHSMAMWCQTHLQKAGAEPMETASKILQLIAMALTPLEGEAGLFFEAAQHMAEAGAAHMELVKSPLGQVADVDNRRPVLLYPLKKEVAQDWVAALEVKKIPDGLPLKFPLCRDIMKRRLSQTFLSGVRGPYPSIVMHHGKAANGEVVFSTHDPSGLKIYHLPGNEVAVVHTPGHKFDPTQPRKARHPCLPTLLSPLFKDGQIAHIHPAGEGVTGQVIYRPESKQLGLKLHQEFLPIADSYNIIAGHCAHSAEDMRRADQHAIPEFSDAPLVAESDMNVAQKPVSPLMHLFRAVADTVTHYVELLNPFAHKQKWALWQAAAYLTVGVSSLALQWPAAGLTVPMFLLCGSMLTKRFAANARSPGEEKVLNVLSGVGAVAGFGTLGYDIASDMSREKAVEFLSHDSLERGGAALALAGVALWNAKQTVDIFRGPKHHHTKPKVTTLVPAE